MIDIEQLDASEMAYHQRVVAQISAARSVEQSWASHLSAKYGLGAGDVVSESGVVTRAPVERSEPAPWTDPLETSAGAYG
jgi:hypothetical protein